MRDDDVINELLRQALAGDVPELSPAFDANVMKRVRPGRLATTDRMVIVVYSVMAAATAAWLMRDLEVELIATAVVIAAPIAAGASAYGRRLAFGA